MRWVKLIFELGSGIVDACVVAIVDKEDAYGYSLTLQVQSVIDIIKLR